MVSGLGIYYLLVSVLEKNYSVVFVPMVALFSGLDVNFCLKFWGTLMDLHGV